MKLDPDMHIGMHLVFFGKSGVTTSRAGHMQVRKHALRTPFLLGGGGGAYPFVSFSNFSYG
jgi:hypothetical protein